MFLTATRPLIFRIATCLLLLATTDGAEVVTAGDDPTSVPEHIQDVPREAGSDELKTSELLASSSVPVDEEDISKVPESQDYFAVNRRDSLGKESGRNGRKLKGLRRLAIPLLIILLVKTGILVPLLFGGVALAAFKGLWTGSSALALTAVLALRHLLPVPRIFMMGGGGAHHAHVTDYIADYRRADDYRDDYGRYSGAYGGWK